MEHKKMQMQIYGYILDCVSRQGYPPSVREICSAVGLKSPSTVHFHLKNLEETGYIEKGAGKGRALRPLKDMDGNDINKNAKQVSSDAAPAAVPVGIGDERDPSDDRVPIVGNVAAGSPILATECIEDYLTFDTGGDSSQYFALRVRGYSMKNAGILPDDLVVVKKQQVAVNGQIVVALIEDEATVKRYKRENGNVWLLPENEEYSPIDGNNAAVLGRVVAVVRQYN